MNKLQRKVGKTQFDGIPGAYILVSASKRYAEDDASLKANVSFLYDHGDVCVEWEPEFGPLQIWRKCDETDESAQEHYYYDFVLNRPGDWSQTAVNNYDLPGAFLRGNYHYIFVVLKDWLTSQMQTTIKDALTLGEDSV